MSTGFLAVTAEEVSITTRLLMEARIPIETEGHNFYSILVKFQQRYVMSHRSVVNCRWAKAFGQFCTSDGHHPVSRLVLGA
jgi:hypothetical protein